MDPEQTLADLRAAISRLRAAADGDSNDDEIQAGHDVAEAASALDDWLSAGGFLPSDWQGPRGR
jgi:hypothetical protein